MIADKQWVHSVKTGYYTVTIKNADIAGTASLHNIGTGELYNPAASLPVYSELFSLLYLLSGNCVNEFCFCFLVYYCSRYCSRVVSENHLRCLPCGSVLIVRSSAGLFFPGERSGGYAPLVHTCNRVFWRCKLQLFCRKKRSWSTTSPVLLSFSLEYTPQALFLCFLYWFR